jgi:hypothetical protein
MLAGAGEERNVAAGCEPDLFTISDDWGATKDWMYQSLHI